MRVSVNSPYREWVKITLINFIISIRNMGLIASSLLASISKLIVPLLKSFGTETTSDDVISIG